MTDDHDFGLRSEFYTFAPETLAQELPDFDLVREVGKGSMGIVFEARRKADQSRIALKILPPSLTLTERALARFLREAKSAAAVRHENVVGIHAVVDEGPIPYLVMEYVEGQTLQEKLDKTGPLESREILRIGLQIAEGLAAAHKQ